LNEFFYHLQQFFFLPRKIMVRASYNLRPSLPVFFFQKLDGLWHREAGKGVIFADHRQDRDLYLAVIEEILALAQRQGLGKLRAGGKEIEIGSRTLGDSPSMGTPYAGAETVD
jgi:hypothetical protein